MKTIPIAEIIRDWQDRPCNVNGQPIPAESGIDPLTLGQALTIYLDFAQQIPGIPLDKYQSVAKLGRQLGRAIKAKESTLQITGEQWDLLKSRFCDVGVIARPGPNGGQVETPVFGSLAVRMHIKELVDEAVSAGKDGDESK